MATTLNAYIAFKDAARAALTFYHSVLGGELTVSTFGEAQFSDNPADADLLLHGQLNTAKGYTIMASDTPSSMVYTPPAGISLSISGDEAELLTGYFNQLSEGGKIVEPLMKAPWGDTFGMFVDKFGIAWMVAIQSSAA